MSDLINKEVLRKRMYHGAFEKDSKLQRWDSGCWIRYKMFEDVLEDIPTENRWIPVAERLPEEEGAYLISWTFRGHTNIIVAYYGTIIGRNNMGRCFYISENDLGDVPVDNVTAWMSLPKPYEENENDSN